MLKKYIFVFILFLGFAHFLGDGGVFATTELEEDQERIQQERDAIQSKLSEAEVQLVELAHQLKGLNSQLVDLNQVVGKNEEKIVETEEKIEVAETELQELESELEQLQSNIDQRLELLKDRAVIYQKRGMPSASFIQVVLGSDGFGDFISRVVMMARIAQADNHFIEQLELNQQELGNVQDEYEKTLIALEEKLSDLEELHVEIEKQRQKTVEIMDQLKGREGEQKALIAQLMDQDKDLASQEQVILERYEEELRRQEEARQEAIRQAEAEAKAKAEAEAKAKASNSNLSSRGSSNTAKNSSSEDGWQTFTATAYTAYCVGCSGVTFTGIDLRANPDAKVIAVDPSVIPLGSRVEVKGYGIFLAGDIGGAIKGNKIDIFMPNFSDVISFGVRSVEIRILD